MKSYIFGAGASRGYSGGPNGVPPPLARDFFSTFVKLDIAANPKVLIGDIINYVRDTRGVQPIDFGTWNEDIEAFLTEVQSRIATAEQLKALELGELMHLSKTYSQMLFLFASVLNEIQNGSPYASLARLASSFNDQDALLTFNWDCLLDRVLWETGQWHPYDGYGITFQGYFDDGGHKDQPPHKSAYGLLKLHGSTNWLMPSRNVDLHRRKWVHINTTIPENERPIFCFIHYSGPITPVTAARNTPCTPLRSFS